MKNFKNLVVVYFFASPPASCLRQTKFSVSRAWRDFGVLRLDLIARQSTGPASGRRGIRSLDKNTNHVIINTSVGDQPSPAEFPITQKGHTPRVPTKLLFYFQKT